MKAAAMRTSPRPLDLPVVLAALALATAMVIYSVGWLESDRCLDAGGRVAKYGLDHACEIADGRTVPFALTTHDRVTLMGTWVALFGAVWWTIDRIVGVTKRR